MRNLSWIIFVAFIFNVAQIRSQDFIVNVKDYLSTQVEKDNLKVGDTEYFISSEHVSSISGIHHIYFSQSIYGLEIFGTNSSIHINSETEIISDNNGFQKDLAHRSIASKNPQLTAEQAVFSVADQLGYEITEDLKVLSMKVGESQEVLLSTGGISISPIPVKLKYLPMESGELELVWELAIEEISREHWWNVLVSASTGKIIEKDDFVVNCSMEHHHSDEDSILDNNLVVTKVPSINDLSAGVGAGCSECYEVIRYPLESPLYGDRTVEIMVPNLDASPFGWHDTDGVAGADYTVTRGNNVNAYDGGDNFGYQPEGGTSLNFTGFDFSPIYTEINQYEDASITNLFYWINILHDISYVYGFTEASGNFQNVNYSGEGRGEDSVYGEAQNDSRVCNASFGIPPDGHNPTMRIDICDDKDGVFDNLVISHEFFHGTSIRLVGGSFNVNGLSNREQMGEGWSDWFALLTTMKASDTQEMPRGIGTYYLGFGANGGGIRQYPYTTDLEVNPLTYDSIKTASIPHGVGTVWAAMLWEMTWGLINEYGFDPDLNSFTGSINTDAGNVMAFAIVTEALKLTTYRPGFVDARDAIIMANHSLYDSSTECVIWEAFAKRGLGYAAIQGDSNNIEDGLESFLAIERFASMDIVNDRLCWESGVLDYERGGLPFGGTYSGIGVTDNDDGSSYTFDPSIAGIGSHEITYTLAASDCLLSSFAIDTVEVFVDIEAPAITCQENFFVEVPYGQTSYSLPDLFSRAIDNCSSTLVSRQEPPPGTILGLGSNNINFYATDNSGNESSCSSVLIVVELGFEGENEISIYPNPMREGINIDSKKEILDPLQVSIVDINGRLVMSLNFDEFGFNRFILTNQLQNGIYFIKIKSQNINIVDQLIRH